MISVETASRIDSGVFRAVLSIPSQATRSTVDVRDRFPHFSVTSRT